MRDAVVDQDIPFGPEDVIIYFIDEEEEEGASLKEIFIEADGNLTDWPRGVFNESYELLRKIMQKAQKQ